MGLVVPLRLPPVILSEMSLVLSEVNDRPFLEDDTPLIADHLLIPDGNDIATVLSGILLHVVGTRRDGVAQA